jgi:hypothetical protein
MDTLLVPHKTREYVFQDDCSVVSANKGGAGSVCDLGTVDAIYRTAAQKANARNSFMFANSALLTRCNLILISYVTTSIELSPSSSDEHSYVARESANIPTQRRLTKYRHALEKMRTICIK